MRNKDGLQRWCKECRSEDSSNYAAMFPERIKERTRKQTEKRKNNPKYVNYALRYTRKLKLTVMQGYGGLCVCCGESNIEFLNIDHVDGGGTEERKQRQTQSTYRNIIEDGFPDRYRVLCANCNFSWVAYGYCPHQETRPWIPV